MNIKFDQPQKVSSTSTPNSILVFIIIIKKQNKILLQCSVQRWGKLLRLCKSIHSACWDHVINFSIRNYEGRVNIVLAPASQMSCSSKSEFFCFADYEMALILSCTVIPENFRRQLRIRRLNVEKIIFRVDFIRKF